MNYDVMFEDVMKRYTQAQIDEYASETNFANVNPKYHYWENGWGDPTEREQYIVMPYTINRDSETLERHNFLTIAKILDDNEVHYIEMDTRCPFYGWHRNIYADADDPKAAIISLWLRDSLESYPILDEEGFSELEYDEAIEYFDDYIRTDLLRAVADDILDEYYVLDGGTGEPYLDEYDLADELDKLEGFDLSMSNLLNLCDYHDSPNEVDMSDLGYHKRQELVCEIRKALDKAGYVLKERDDDYYDEEK